MSTPTIVKPSTLDTSLVNFGEVITNAKGGKSVKVGYNDEDKFRIRAPDMFIAFDLTTEESKEIAPGIMSIPKYYFQLSFRGMEKDDASGRSIQSFHEMIDSLDELLIQKGSENSLSWLKMKTAKKEVVEALINRTIKQSKDPKTQEPNGKYPDTMKVRIPVSKDGKLLCDIFDKDGQQIQDISVLKKFKRGAKLGLILECAGLNFMNGKFGFTAWQLWQCRVKQEAKSNGVPTGKCLITDSDDEDYVSERPTSKAQTTPAVVQETVATPSNHVEDSDDDRPPTPEPVQAVAEEPKKKVVRRVVPAKK